MHRVELYVHIKHEADKKRERKRAKEKKKRVKNHKKAPASDLKKCEYFSHMMIHFPRFMSLFARIRKE